MEKTKFKILSLALAMSLTSVNLVACSESKKVVETTPEIYKRTEVITSVKEAKELLVDGNKRFIAGKISNKDMSDTRRKELVAKGQHPYAVIVSCSDSRVPPEILFDGGMGDIFVIRDAGNVIDPVVLGSIEYGAEHLKAPLILVLGHDNCGAVKATVEGGEAPGSIGSIVNNIKSAFAKAKATGAKETLLFQKTEDENIKTSVAAIEQSPIIKELEEKGEVKVMGAKYHIESGQVIFNE